MYAEIEVEDGGNDLFWKTLVAGIFAIPLMLFGMAALSGIVTAFRLQPLPLRWTPLILYLISIIILVVRFPKR
jgi:hypothetical protein